jgi:hypothetical protein
MFVQMRGIHAPNGPRHAVVLVALLLAAGSAAAGGLSSEEPLRIGSIRIIASDVFTEEEAALGSTYALTNSLHVTTRHRVIRRFLLFEEGDEYVPSRLEESERILRAQKFLHFASVTAGEPHDGVVDVVVVTQDSWSTQPGGNVGSAGGETDYGFAIEETNFMGLGKQLTVLYESGLERTGYGVQYEDPAFISPHWNANLLMMNNSDGTQLEVAVDRPFYAFATPWSVSAAVSDRQFTSRVYSEGAVVGEFDQLHSGFSASYGLALAPDDSRAHRLSFGVDWQSDEFQPIAVDAATPLPDSREYRYLFVDYEFGRNRFAKVNFLNLDQRYEDLRIGSRFDVRLSVSPSLLGVDRTTGLIAASASRGLEIGPAILLAGVSFESRIGADNRNAIAGGDLRIIRQYETRRPQTTVGRVSITYGSDLDPDMQFFADGSTGLRGYRLHSFAGDSSMVLNLEHRIYLGREIWKSVSPGVAFFVDAGNAAYGSAAFDPGNLKLDAGFGLRFGLTRTTKNVFRLDFAYALDPDPYGRQGWLVSFSGGQAF